MPLAFGIHGLPPCRLAAACPLVHPVNGQSVELCSPVAMRWAWPADGLPGFDGAVNAATGAGAGEGEPAARYLAALCQQSLLEFQAQHSWDQQLLPGVETGALQCGQLASAPDASHYGLQQVQGSDTCSA